MHHQQNNVSYHSAMAGFPQVLATMPASNLFTFPPSIAPVPLPPAPVATSILRPFNIPDNIYLAALDPKVPLTIAATYAITAKLLNVYNKSRNKQPWSISKTRPFFAFVVLHNVFLAVYSAWTFWGMVGVMRRSISNPFGPGGIAATADSFCRLQGPPGLGNSIYFNDTLAGWDTASPSTAAALLAGNGIPSSTEMGRIWNEGLAYYGWLFYLSKFYEVLDTFIILAKGKFSSTLQTYHHAGAMMSMWAGMRYMSAPIWIFCLFNSFIHALMYTYYTLSAFSIKIPVSMKRTLTTMQITQFIVGASIAMVHSFITYIVPLTKSAKTWYIAQPCIATSSETFAIWLNVVYLAPLTYLFVSFFIASYIKRSNAAQKIHGKRARRMSNNVALAEKAGWDAARNVEREVYGGEHMAGSGSSSPVMEVSPQRLK